MINSLCTRLNFRDSRRGGFLELLIGKPGNADTCIRHLIRLGKGEKRRESLCKEFEVHGDCLIWVVDLMRHTGYKCPNRSKLIRT